MLFFQPPVVEPLVHQPNQPMEGVCDEEVHNDLIGRREQDVTMADGDEQEQQHIDEEDQGSMSDKGLIADGGVHDEIDVGGGGQQEGAIADGGEQKVN